MNEVREFLSVVNKQRSLLCDLAELDSYFTDVEPCDWKLRRANNRRGWTSQDIRYHDEAAANDVYGTDLSLADRMKRKWQFISRKHPATTRARANRVSTGLRQLSSIKQSKAEDAAKKAIEYCNSVPQFATLSALTFRLLATHLEWMSWIDPDGNGPPTDVHHRWKDEERELSGMVSLASQFTNNELGVSLRAGYVAGDCNEAFELAFAESLAALTECEIALVKAMKEKKGLTYKEMIFVEGAFADLSPTAPNARLRISRIRKKFNSPTIKVEIPEGPKGGKRLVTLKSSGKTQVKRS